MFIRHLSTTTGPQRLVYGLVCGIAAGFSPWPLEPAFRALGGWCVGLAVYLALAWWLAAEFGSDETRARAQAQDEPSALLFLVMLAAVLACVAAIGLLLQQAKDLHGIERALHIAVAMVALALSWLFIQTIFAFRYAHRYYQAEDHADTDAAGLDFPDKQDPDYADFLYYSHVIGMTSQVSDVQVTSREMRRITLIHSVLSFAFNMLILALSINVVAGAL